ncbi:MAG: hypothetical protein Q8M94_05975 [Ignavibacteria bacterium]|nr:hypothetical protein [Ignavibacteria bacterium]
MKEKGGYMATVRSLDESSSISIRFSNRLLERIDRFIKWFKKEYPGMSVGRPDVIRMAVERLISKPSSTPNFLDALENDLMNDSKKSTRYYSSAEIKEFDEEDKIPSALMKKAKKALSKR